MSQQTKHICFYSNKDKWSKAFIEELASTPWVKEFQFICVDPGQNRPSLPKWLKQVPTLVIDGDSEPVKTDTAVMNWLWERKMKEMPTQSKSSTATTQAVVTGEPASWMDNEMGGYGNAGYSFIDSDSSKGDAGTTLPGTFTYLNGTASPGDRQSDVAISQTLSNQGTRSKKEVMFDRQLEQYKQQRDSGIPQGPPRQ